MSICVLGGSGFLGNSIVELLLKKNLPVKVIGRKKNYHHKIEYMSLDDFFDDKISIKFLADISVIINCIGESKNPSDMQKVNIELLEKILRKVNSIKQFIHISSIGVYGNVRKGTIVENFSKNPSNIYQKSKSGAEDVLISYAKINNFAYTIIRPSKILGENIKDPALKLLINFIYYRLFFFVGEKGSSFNYIYYIDLINYIYNLVSNSKSYNQIYNISDHITLEEAVKIIKDSRRIKTKFPRLPENIIRFIIGLFKPFTFFPLNEERLDALITKTIFSDKKIKETVKLENKIGITNALTKILSSKH